MSHPSKAKGDRVERKMVHLLRALGLPAERTGLAAQAGKSVDEDITTIVPGLGTMTVEVKTRKDCRGYAQPVAWIDECDALILDVPRGEPLVCLKWQTFSKLMGVLDGLVSEAAKLRQHGTAVPRDPDITRDVPVRGDFVPYYSGWDGSDISTHPGNCECRGCVRVPAAVER